MNLRRTWLLLLGTVLIGSAVKPGVAANKDTANQSTADRNSGNNAQSASPDSVVIEAWEKAGAKFCWMRVNSQGLLTPRAWLEPSANDIPTFRFSTRNLGSSLQGLPQPSLPFAVASRNAEDADLKELAGLKQLRWLCLNNSKVTDAGLKELAGITQLQALNLCGTKLTDAGLKELAGLTQLRSLWLFDTQVTDAGLKELVWLKQLQTLDLRNTKVTDAGVKQFKQDLPDCGVWP